MPATVKSTEVTYASCDMCTNALFDTCTYDPYTHGMQDCFEGVLGADFMGENAKPDAQAFTKVKFDVWPIFTSRSGMVHHYDTLVLHYSRQ